MENSEKMSQFNIKRIEKKSVEADDQSVFSQDSFGPSSQQDSNAKLANCTSAASQKSSIQTPEPVHSIKPRSKKVIDQELQSISKGWRQPTQSDINTLFVTVNQSARALTETTQKFVASNQENTVPKDLEDIMATQSKHQTPGQQESSSSLVEEMEDRPEPSTTKSTPTQPQSKKRSF